MLLSSFTRLPVIGFGTSRGLGSVGIAFSESLYERQVVPRYPTFFQITQNDGVRAKSNVKTKIDNILMEGGQVLKHVPHVPHVQIVVLDPPPIRANETGFLWPFYINTLVVGTSGSFPTRF